MVQKAIKSVLLHHYSVYLPILVILLTLKRLSSTGPSGPAGFAKPRDSLDLIERHAYSHVRMASICAQILKVTPKAYQNSVKIVLNHGNTLYTQLPNIARVAAPAVPFALWMIFPALTADFKESIGLPSGVTHSLTTTLSLSH